MELAVKDRVSSNGEEVQFYVTDEAGAVVYTEKRNIEHIRVLKCGDGYVVIDKRTGEVLAENGDKLYKTAEGASKGYTEAVHKELKEKARVYLRVKDWMEKNKVYMQTIKSLVTCGVNSVDRGYLLQFFKANRIETEFTVDEFMEVLTNSV